MCLAVLNKHSEATDAAGMLKYFIANFASIPRLKTGSYQIKFAIFADCRTNDIFLKSGRIQ